MDLLVGEIKSWGSPRGDSCLLVGKSGAGVPRASAGSLVCVSRFPGLWLKGPGGPGAGAYPLVCDVMSLY